VIGEQIAIDAETHGVAHAVVDGAVDKNMQGFAH
jgi:hypothetical protein